MPIAGSFVSSFGFGRRAGVYPTNSLYDPYFSNVVLLLHMDGSNGSTTFIDSSSTPKTVTPFGSAQISTADSKFGGAAGFFNNTDAYLTTPHHSSFNFATGDWTVELYCKINPVESDIIINKATNFGFFPFQIRVFGNRFNARGYSNSGQVYNLGVTSGPTVVAGTWYHVALCRQSNNFLLYVDGNLVEYSSSSATLFSGTTPVSIAGLSNGQGLMAGYMEDVRITVGVCRYPNGISFPVPTTAFPNS